MKQKEEDGKMLRSCVKMGGEARTSDNTLRVERNVFCTKSLADPLIGYLSHI
jgi:hypothetical protein